MTRAIVVPYGGSQEPRGPNVYLHKDYDFGIAYQGDLRQIMCRGGLFDT